MKNFHLKTRISSERTIAPHEHGETERALTSTASVKIAPFRTQMEQYIILCWAYLVFKSNLMCPHFICSSPKFSTIRLHANIIKHRAACTCYLFNFLCAFFSFHSPSLFLSFLLRLKLLSYRFCAILWKRKYFIRRAQHHTSPIHGS